jgi:hypothetical protein
MKKTQNAKADLEIGAIGIVHGALEKLESDARVRVLSYVGNMFGISIGLGGQSDIDHPLEARVVEPERSKEREIAAGEDSQNPSDLEGISPVARKWMARNSLDASKLGSIFSLGVDEIDLIAKTVPGKTKTEKAQNVFLLKGAASYIGTGASRFTHEQIKETCVHYGAYDGTNFASQIKSFSGTVSGSKNTGYALTTRGLSEATALIASMTGQAKS